MENFYRHQDENTDIRDTFRIYLYTVHVTRMQTKTVLIPLKQYQPVQGPVCLLVDNYIFSEYLQKVNEEYIFCWLVAINGHYKI